MNHLHKIIKYDADELVSAFEKAKIEGSGTPQEISDRREASLSKFLKKYFPFPFRITKGNVRDSFGQSSQSIDCLVLNPVHPYTTSDDGPYSAILADGVDVAIELKPELNSDAEIERALGQISSVKKLKRVKSSKTPFFGHTTKGEMEKYRRIPGLIFSDTTYVNIKTLLVKVAGYYSRNSTPRILQFDAIVINKRCIIINSSPANYNSILTNGFTIINTGEDTLATFLFLLSAYPSSNTDFNQNKNILFHYLKLNDFLSTTYDDINSDLVKLPNFDDGNFGENDKVNI